MLSDFCISSMVMYFGDIKFMNIDFVSILVHKSYVVCKNLFVQNLQEGKTELLTQSFNSLNLEEGTNYNIINVIHFCYKNRLELFSQLFEESPAWFCSHLLAMIQLVGFVNHFC